MSISTENISDLAGIRISQDACVVIVRTEWNAHIVDLLEEGCRSVLEAQGVTYKVLTVPGAFEISFAIKNYYDSQKYTDHKPSAFIALGCVIQGDTPHFDYVCQAVTNGIGQLNLSMPIPTIFGILTVHNDAQALERTGGRHGHKGREAAATAIKMIHLVEHNCTRKPMQK